MRTLMVEIRPRPSETKIRAASGGRTVLTARLAASPWHRRALPSLLEGLALWQGLRVQAAVAADERAFCSDTVLCDGRFAELGASPLYELVPVLTRREVLR
jgi:hypothetical protein